MVRPVLRASTSFSLCVVLGLEACAHQVRPVRLELHRPDGPLDLPRLAAMVPCQNSIGTSSLSPVCLPTLQPSCANRCYRAILHLAQCQFHQEFGRILLLGNWLPTHPTLQLFSLRQPLDISQEPPLGHHPRSTETSEHRPSAD